MAHNTIWDIYYCVEMVRTEKNSHMLEITCEVVFLRFLKLLALLHTKYFKRGLFCKKLGTQHYLIYIILSKWLEWNTIIICFKLRDKLRF